MSERRRRPREPFDVTRVVRAAERLDSMADTAELMGDDAGAARFRADAAARRMLAMHLLDDPCPPT